MSRQPPPTLPESEEEAGAGGHVGQLLPKVTKRIIGLARLELTRTVNRFDNIGIHGENKKGR